MHEFNASICRALFPTKIRVKKNKEVKKFKLKFPFSMHAPSSFLEQ